VQWHFDVYWTALASDLVFSVGRSSYAGDFYTRWQAQIFNGSVLLESLYMYQLYNFQQCATIGEKWTESDIPFGPGTNNVFSLTQATYAQGGSPWS
jgi:hypothetical protein